jgi:exodeoxyribonuclease VII small subunit
MNAMPGRQKPREQRTFEQTMHRLEEIVARLEEGNISLEESIEMYEEGILLSRQCMEKLNEAEQRLKTLGRDVMGNFLVSEEEEEEE